MSATHEFVLRDRQRSKLGQRVAVAFGVALVGAALTFFAALFLAIMTLTLLAFYRHSAGRPGAFSQLVDMRMAYRMIAAPIAAAALPIAFAASMWFQSRQHRVPRT